MRCTASEIEEETMSDLFEIGQPGASASLGKEEDLFEGSLFSYDIHRGGEVEEEDSLYVAVGKDETSMDALTWALRTIPADKAMTTTVYLVHVFPQTRSIPSPCKLLPSPYPLLCGRFAGLSRYLNVVILINWNNFTYVN